MKFYKCELCGQIVEVINGSCCTPVCCGQPMTELIAGSVDAAQEKHVPVYSVEEGKVQVNIGSVEHPMTQQHYIEWVILVTKKGIQRKHLTPDDAPKVCFHICKCDEVVEVYAYCNLHGLWKS